jgi:hypothetical protein
MPPNPHSQKPHHREEVLNVTLATLLHRSGVVAAPEQILNLGFDQGRIMPDVLVDYQGLRMVIEGRIVTGATAANAVLRKVRERVQQGIAHVGVAIIYPSRMREVPFEDLEQELSSVQLQFAITSEVEDIQLTLPVEEFPDLQDLTMPAFWSRGDMNNLADVLRRTYEKLVQEDIVGRAVHSLHSGINVFSAVILASPGSIERSGQALGIRQHRADHRNVDRTHLVHRSRPSRQAVSVSRIAALVVANALIFQEVLSISDDRVQTLRRMLQGADTVGSLSNHWRFILDEIDYYPIFDIAREVLLSLSSTPETDRAIKTLTTTGLDIVRHRAALRHDLMGRVYHRLLEERETKSLATFYTSVSAATLLLKLALQPSKWSTAWSSAEEMGAFRIGDLACGTGTLLMAAAEAITDNYVRACMQNRFRPDFDVLQRLLVETVIFGYDVTPSARHLTASTLALRSPGIGFKWMNLWSLPFGEPGQRLGSIEFLLDRNIALQDFAREAGAIERVSATDRGSQESAVLPDLDLCVMNPPFTRSSQANLLFGSLPEGERAGLQRRLARLLRGREIEATGTAGLASVFVATGDRAVKPGGRLALVLPKAVLSGGSWQSTRQLLGRCYELEYLIVSHDPERWNFSDNTNLSEVLLIARKKDDVVERSQIQSVTCINLWRNPRTVFEALGVAQCVASGFVPSVMDDQGALEINVSDTKFGEAVSVPLDHVNSISWMPHCAYAQSEMTRVIHHLLIGQLYLPRSGITTQSPPLVKLSDLGTLGPDIRDIYDGFELSEGRTIFPAFWGHDSMEVNTLAQTTNAFLAPLSMAREGRHLRHTPDLWPKASRLAIATRLRLNTQHMSAIRLNQEALSNVWWPFRLHKPTEAREKALILWLNSTLGLLLLLANRQEVEGSWIALQKPVLNNLLVLDLDVLSAEQISRLVETFDSLSTDPVLPFPQLANDRTRQRIDEELVGVLGLPDISLLRECLALEPIVSTHSLS